MYLPAGRVLATEEFSAGHSVPFSASHSVENKNLFKQSCTQKNYLSLILPANVDPDGNRTIFSRALLRPCSKGLRERALN